MSPAQGAEAADVAFEELLEGRAEGLAALARASLALIRDLDPEVVEVPWPKQAVVGFGVGPRKFSQHYAYLALHRGHVNLGFNQGAELDDPTHLLSGLGKSMRHRRLDSPDDLQDAALCDLLVRARAHRAATTHSSGGSRSGRT